ncbi:hypothetical protein [Solidesulfovibrio sp.]
MAGSVLVLTVAVREVDPVLGLGVLALNGIRLIRIVPQDRAGRRTSHEAASGVARTDEAGSSDAGRKRP